MTLSIQEKGFISEGEQRQRVRSLPDWEVYPSDDTYSRNDFIAVNIKTGEVRFCDPKYDDGDPSHGCPIKESTFNRHLWRDVDTWILYGEFCAPILKFTEEDVQHMLGSNRNGGTGDPWVRIRRSADAWRHWEECGTW